MIKVQVKTTTAREGRAWKVFVSTTSGGRRAYADGEVDEFFVVDGDGTCYRIPAAAVAGKKALSLAAYDRYAVGSAPCLVP